MRPLLALLMTLAATAVTATAQIPNGRARARDLGVAPGVFPPGANNAITDVNGVLVGQTTVTDGDSVHTGITAIRAHSGNQYLDRVPAAVHVGNAFGKLVGSTQVKELGELETPILLTCTLCVWKAADAMVEWMLAQPGMERVGSLNPVVGETNDGGLNAIRSRPITAEHVRAALDGAKSGPVAEGSVGAGAGTQAFSWKGESVRHRASFRSRWAATQWACSCSRTSVGSFRCSVRRWARSSAATRSRTRSSVSAGTDRS